MVRLGNFVGDRFKGRIPDDLPEGIQEGLRLHRRIDAFADSHPAMKESYLILKKRLGRYALPVVDVLQDHFLSIHFARFAEPNLNVFTSECITDLKGASVHLESEHQQSLERMFVVNWLAKYGTDEGMQRSLYNLSRRTRYENGIADCWTWLKHEKDELEPYFLEYFPEALKTFLPNSTTYLK